MAAAISTVAAGFKELLARLELNPTRVALASQRYKAVGERIHAALRNKEVCQVGSFRKKN